MSADFFKTLYESLTPAGKRNYIRHKRAALLGFKIQRTCFWLNWPILNVMTTFWTEIFESNSPLDALSFAYLNDGIKPSLWHTCMQICNSKKYSGIWIGGAPKNKREAEERH